MAIRPVPAGLEFKVEEKVRRNSIVGRVFVRKSQVQLIVPLREMPFRGNDQTVKPVSGMLITQMPEKTKRR